MEYNGLKLDDRLAQLIRYLPKVDDLRETICRYQAVWGCLICSSSLNRWSQQTPY